LYVLLGEYDAGLEVGRIEFIIVHKCTDVYFLVYKCNAIHLSHVHLYSICEEYGIFCLVDVKLLLDYYPLAAYSMKNLKVFALHHMFLS